MKKFLLATVAIAAFGAAMPADAADLGYGAPYKAAPYAAPLYNWTGFYVGAHVGGAFSSDARKFLEDSVAVVIQKPFRLEDMLALIDRTAGGATTTAPSGPGRPAPRVS